MERKGHVKLPSFNELTSSFQQAESRGDIVREGDDNSNYTTSPHPKQSIFGVVQNVQDTKSQRPLEPSISIPSEVTQPNIILQNPTIETPNQSSPGYFTLYPTQPGPYQNIQFKKDHHQNYSASYQNPYYQQFPQSFPYPGSFNEPNRPQYGQIQDPNMLKLYQQQQQQQQQYQHRIQIPQYYTPYPQHTGTSFQQTQLPTQQQSSYHSPVEKQMLHAPPPPPPTALEMQQFRQSPYIHQQQGEFGPSQSERVAKASSQAQGSEIWIQNTPFKFPSKAPLQTGNTPSCENRVTVLEEKQKQGQDKHQPVKKPSRQHTSKKNPLKSVEISVPLHRRAKSLNFSIKSPAGLRKNSQGIKPSEIKPIGWKPKEGSSSNVTTEKVIDEKQRFMEMFGDVINMLQDFSGFDELLSKFNQLGNFLNENDRMKYFINIEKERLKVNGEFFNSSYKIEEFYRFLREFPIEELIFLRDGFLNSYSLIDHWVKIVDSPERSFLKDLKIETEIAVEDEPLSETELVGLRTDKIIKKAKRLSSDHREEKLEAGGVPGELVTLQVDPLKPIEDTSSTKFAPRGFLHQDLSMKPKTVCMQCGSTSTPEWRKGPEDAKTLCNACGLFHTKLVKKIGSRGAAEFMKKRREQGNRTNRRIAD